MRRRTHELCERVKELNCLYSISKLMERPGIALRDILRGIVALLPPAWQFPSNACARIVLDGEEISARIFRATPWRQSAPIRASGARVGRVEVFYLRRPRGARGVFLREERDLLRVIAGRIGKVVERFRADEALRRTNEQLRDLSRHLRRVREDERARIAHEIHDDMGQALTALKMEIACLAQGAAGEALADRVRALCGHVDAIIDGVRRIAAELRPAILDDLGLGPAIVWQAREFSARTGIACRILLDREEFNLDAEQATMVFRVFQEVLTNVARHANARRVDGRVEIRGRSLLLVMRDDGRGIRAREVSDPQSFGIMGIRERVQAEGGAVSIEGRPGRGTTVSVRIPLRRRGEGR